jgi:hypothetical protein
MINLLHVLTAWMFCLLLSCVAEPLKNDEHTKDTSAVKLKEHAVELKKYAVQKNANSGIGIFVDMSIHSWKKRFFVVDLNSDSVLVSGLCAHGQGKDFTNEEVEFSNVPGSLCTSEGHYLLGYKYHGDYGWAYKLTGLDSTNSNAFKRVVVFHYYSCMSDFEDQPVCRSNGCPMVSENVFKAAAKLIDVSSKPILMWIYK